MSQEKKGKYKRRSRRKRTRKTLIVFHYKWWWKDSLLRELRNVLKVDIKKHNWTRKQNAIIK
jgi:hypothetical protein